MTLRQAADYRREHVSEIQAQRGCVVPKRSSRPSGVREVLRGNVRRGISLDPRIQAAIVEFSDDLADFPGTTYTVS